MNTINSDIKARWTTQAVAPIQAASKWKEKCLLNDGSVFTDRKIWTQENVNHLDHYFVQNPILSKESFWSKLEVQLKAAPAGAKQLAAEMFWVMYLIVYKEAMTAATKRLQIRQAWEWSGEPLPEARFELGEALEEGIARPGTSYNTNRWRELTFFIDFVQRFKHESTTKRAELLQDAWRMAEWVDALPSAKGRQLRHILLFLLFPNEFDPIVTGSHKREIVKSFKPVFGESADTVNYDDRTAVDRELYRIRERLPEKYGSGNLDFYRAPLRDVWQPPEETSSPPSGTNLDQWYRSIFGEARLWIIGAGEAARLWDSFREGGFIGIGADFLGDLKEYDSREQIHAAIVEEQGEGSNPLNDSLACWEFAHLMKAGDWVVVKKGTSEILAWGKVASDYIYDETRAEYDHVRKVEWHRLGNWPLPKNRRVAPKTLTNFSEYKDWIKYAWELTEEKQPPKPAPEETDYDVRVGSAGLFMPVDRFKTIVDTLARRKNLIIQGPPGVGKTYMAKRIAYALMGQRCDKQVQMIQFHQSYAYEDFMQGWRPTADKGFSLQDGVFYRFCDAARANPDQKFVFIIDEINRGNLSKIFGELMMLIEADKRGSKNSVPLTYSPAKTFDVPENVYVIGLMNTADRSLAMVDYALRRRFAFVTLEPAYSSEQFKDELARICVPEELIARIADSMTSLNQQIREDVNLGSGFQIGHSYFVPQENEESVGDEWYRQIVRTEIQPLLEEYWIEEPERVNEAVARLIQ